MNLQLQKPELERFIEEQVKFGNYPTQEVVVEAALHLMMEGEELTDEDVESILISEQQLDRGEGIPAEQVKSLISELKERTIRERGAR